MTLVTFQDKHPQLLRLPEVAPKVTTIRANAERWVKIQRRAIDQGMDGALLHMWWRSPRTKHPQCYRMGLATLWKIQLEQGKHFGIGHAAADGFTSVSKLFLGLRSLNNMTTDEVLQHLWAVLYFKWHVGYPLFPPYSNKLSIRKEVPIPAWDCQAGSVMVTCSNCNHEFCAGCSCECPRCGSGTVWRDWRWDYEDYIDRLGTGIIERDAYYEAKATQHIQVFEEESVDCTTKEVIL